MADKQLVILLQQQIIEIIQCKGNKNFTGKLGKSFEDFFFKTKLPT